MAPGHRRTLLSPRPHQRAAIEAVTAHLLDDDAPRATVVMACGTGKTLVAAVAAADIHREDRNAGATLVLLPTLALLEQTIRSWRESCPDAFTAFAFCSEQEIVDHHITENRVSSTTDPDTLATWISDTTDFTVVFGTYHSTPQVARAHRDHRLPDWRFIVADEAHRTLPAAGHDAAFATVLDNQRMPADKRLFLTATPRLRVRASEVITMTDRHMYGPTVYRLPLRDAIDAGLLSRYEVVVAAIDDADVRTILDKPVRLNLVGGGDIDLRAAASQMVLGRVAWERSVTRILAYHNTVAASKRWTRTLPIVMAAADPDSAGSWSVHHLDGTMTAARRRATISALENVHHGVTGVVSNVRVFTEGIDVPALDAIMFCDPRSSEIDVAQAVGRALRKHPDGDRPALIILPVLVATAPTPGATVRIDQTAFNRVVDVLRALIDHDPALALSLATSSDAGGGHPDALNTPAGAVSFHGPPRLATAVFQAMRTSRLFTSGSESLWAAGYSVLRRAATELRRFPAGREEFDGFPLGNWIDLHLRLYGVGALAADRVALLNSIPRWGWSRAAMRFEYGFAHLIDWLAIHGNATPPRTAVTSDGFRLGDWAHRTRRAHAAGALPLDYCLRLEQLCGWSWGALPRSTFRRGITALNTWFDTNTVLPPHGTTVDRFPLSDWLHTQRHQYVTDQLPPEQRHRLTRDFPHLTTAWDKDDNDLLDVG